MEIIMPRKTQVKYVMKQKFPIMLFALFLLFALSGHRAYSIDDARKVEDLIVTEKEIEKEKEKALVEHFYEEGRNLLEEGDYEGSVDRFSRVLEIDPEHRGARRYLKTVKKKMIEERRLGSPDAMAKRLFRSGKIKYSAGDYEDALEDLQDALVLDYDNEDTLEWIKRTRRRISLEEVKTEERDLKRQTKVATRRKEAQEKAAMLEVEEAYLPPKKPERKPLEIEELMSPEEARQEKARKELLERLQEKTVPAVSLTEADIRDVIRQLMEVTGVTIVIDEGALAEAAGTEPLRMTFTTVTPMPLLEVLDIALRATELSYRVEPHYIWISTPEKLEKQDLVTRTYRLKYGVRRIRKVELKEFETKSTESD
jgi:tetratricopeptide (TPR) repeat protein